MKTIINLTRLPLSILLFSQLSPCFAGLSSDGSGVLDDTATINKTIVQIRDLIKTDSKEAYTLSRKVIKASEKINYGQGILDGYYSLAYILKRGGKLDSAKRSYRKCIVLAEKNKNLRISASTYINLANIYSMQSEYDSALYFSRYAHQISLKEADTTFQIITINNIAIIYRYLGMWDSSLSVLKENERLAKLKKDTVRLGTCLQLQASILQGQGNLKAALEYYYKALEVLNQTKRMAPVYLVKVDIAKLYLELGEHRKSIDLLNSIKEGYASEIQGQMTIYNTLGKAYQGINNFDSAFYYHQLSLEECNSTNQPGKAAMAYRFLGDLLNQQGKYAEAAKYLEHGIDVCDIKNMKEQYAITCNSLGTSYLNLNKTAQAKKCFSEAMKIGKELNDIAILKESANGLQQVNFTTGNYKAAYQYMALYKIYSDSLLNSENIRAMTTKDLEYEFHKEKSAIMQQQTEERLLHQESLKRQKLIRNSIIIVCLLLIIISLITYRSYTARKRSDNEKASLMKEIHHRVKNNLQIIGSLLNIQKEYLTDSNVIGAVEESQSRVKAMALIHQLLYQKEIFTHIDFKNYLNQLMAALAGIYDKSGTKATTEVVAEKISLDIDTSIPLGLIVTELVSNSYKYAFRDGKQGKITVRMSKKQRNNYELLISDNGQGLPQNFDIESSHSMGLKLVRLFADQLDAGISYFNDKGTHFKLTFSES